MHETLKILCIAQYGLFCGDFRRKFCKDDQFKKYALLYFSMGLLQYSTYTQNRQFAMLPIVIFKQTVKYLPCQQFYMHTYIHTYVCTITLRYQIYINSDAWVNLNLQFSLLMPSDCFIRVHIDYMIQTSDFDLYKSRKVSYM